MNENQIKNCKTFINANKIIYAKQISSYDRDNGNGTITPNVPIIEEVEFTPPIRGNIFYLDLETGKRGYYPGCKIIYNIYDNNVTIFAEPSTQSPVIQIIDHPTLEIIDPLYNSRDDWIYAKWNGIDNNGIIGYVYIKNLNYTVNYTEDNNA